MKPTQEQVLQWAHETFRRQGDGFAAIDSEVMRFFTIAYEAGRKDENDACAKVCENMCGPIEIYNPAYVHYVGCAEAIRARGQHESN